MAFFESIGFRLDHGYPSDGPVVARMYGLGVKLRLDRNSAAKPVSLKAARGVSDARTMSMVAMYTEVGLSHTTDISFTFILSGGVKLRATDAGYQFTAGTSGRKPL